MATFQQLIDRGRYTLQDDAKVRYTDAELMAYATIWMGTTFRDRKDAFMGLSMLGSPLPAYAIGDTFPLEGDFEQPLIDYVVGRAEAKNAESGDEARAAGFLAQSKAGAQ